MVFVVQADHGFKWKFPGRGGTPKNHPYFHRISHGYINHPFGVTPFKRLKETINPWGNPQVGILEARLPVCWTRAERPATQGNGMGHSLR